MSRPPERPKIYHIAHVDTLLRIITAGELVCHAEMEKRGGPPTAIGISSIKAERMRLPVKCHPGDVVGDYVPFYFCPRSIMLFLLARSNDPRLTYRGGQDPIVHLEADLRNAVAWAEGEERRWAFTLSNAGARYTEFRSDLHDLNHLNWEAIRATDWRAPDIKEAKQAEFLMRNSFPFHLVTRIGVRTPAIKARVEEALEGSDVTPVTEVLPAWYY